MAGGGKFQTGFQIERGYDQVANIGTRRDYQESPEGGNAAKAMFAGAFTDNVPVDLVSDRDRNGQKFHSFFDDFYNRVYFLPPTVGFGPISATSTREVRLWNAHLTPVDLASITLQNADGLTLDGPTVPYTFDALEIAIYTLTASTDGPPTLDADITFAFTPTESFTLEVTGARAKVSPFTPNWRKSYSIDYQFKTDIFTSRAGKEQRRALRSTPRKSLSFEATPTFSQLRAFNQLMASWHDNTIILPEIPRQAVLATAMPGGAAIANLTETIPDWAVAGATVVLAYRGQYETRKIDTASGTQIVFTGVSALDWPVGSKVHPGIAGRMAATIGSTRETNAAGVVNIQFDVTPASEPVIALPAAPQTFNGRELFTVKPNWAKPPDAGYESHREVLDYARGRTTVFTPVEYLTRTAKFTYTGRNYQDMNLIREFFERMAGQQGEFYMPTWESDIVLKTVSPAGSASLRIYGTQFAADYAGSTVHKAVAIYMKDGSVIHNVVQDIFEVDDADGQDSAIQLQDLLAVDVGPDTVKSISWLLVWRHATDTLTIEWLTNAVGQCQMTVRSLEDLPV